MVSKGRSIRGRVGLDKSGSATRTGNVSLGCGMDRVWYVERSPTDEIAIDVPVLLGAEGR